MSVPSNVLTVIGARWSLDCWRTKAFLAGDVRRGSTKRLASAGGEGAAAVIQIRL